MIKKAEFSDCGKYRYFLSRIWDESKPIYLFIGLNPSIANDEDNDNTISRCINLIDSWGGGGLYMANLFAYIATNPQVMKQASDPIGIDNDFFLETLSDSAFKIVACWGNDGSHRGRSLDVINLLKNKDMFCLHINNSGEPHHPSRISNTQLIKYP